MKNKFLIILIIIIVLTVSGLGYYTYFIWNKEAVVSKLDLSDVEVSTVLDSFPYQILINNKDMKVKDLSTEQIIYIGYDGLTENQIVFSGSWTCDTDDNTILVKCIAKSLNLTDEQTGKMNTSLWEDYLAGGTGYEMVSPELMSTIINNKLGLSNIFNESFKKTVGEGFLCSSLGFIYDKDINMVFTHQGGACAAMPNYTININSGSKENYTYKIKFTEGVFAPKESTPITFDLYSRSNPTVILEAGISTNKSEDEMKALVDKHKSSLDTYEITFKKVGNNYQFVSLDYIK